MWSWASLVDETLERELRQFTRPDLLVIDEVGLEQANVVPFTGDR